MAERSAPIPVSMKNSKHRNTLAEPGVVSPRIGRRVGLWFLRELREMVPPVIFFFTGFNIIVLTTNLILADYSKSVGNFMLATGAALLVAKAVLIANPLPLMRRYDRAALIRPILFKTVVYWVIVGVVRLLEHFIEFSLVDTHPVRDFLPHMIATFSWHRFAAIQIWILVLFLIYVSATEFSHLLGKGKLWDALFSRRPPETPSNRRQGS